VRHANEKQAVNSLRPAYCLPKHDAM